MNGRPDWGAIKAHYKRSTLAIYEAGRNLYGIDKYAWEHEAGVTLTPIERALWSDICAEGLVMYPQYPVAGYFVDFANPVARVAIECDGARWHTRPELDAIRQKAIEDNGWTVYRVSGSDCMKNSDYVEDERGRQKWTVSDAAKLLRAIRDKHGIAFGTLLRAAA